MHTDREITVTYGKNFDLYHPIEIEGLGKTFRLSTSEAITLGAALLEALQKRGIIRYAINP